MWSPDQMPDVTGRTFIITGANSGIGFHAAKHLVDRGAHVIIGCRRQDAAEKAAAKIDGHGSIEAIPLDLADFESIDAFVDAAPDSIDVLVNNAGIMMVPYALTPQGHESQWGVNVVGHARLTKALLPRIVDRVVTVSSLAHRRGSIEPGTFRDHEGYSPWAAYAQSKLGDLCFALRLQEHLDEQRSEVKSVACHPGVSLTRLAKDMPLGLKIGMVSYVPFLQSGEKGSWPTLRAATDDVLGGSYWGPAGRNEWRGPPVPAHVAKRALDAENQAAVWDAVW